MFEPAPMVIVSMSPRATTPYQTPAPSSSTTDPIRVAVTATKADSSTEGTRSSMAISMGAAY